MVLIPPTPTPDGFRLRAEVVVPSRQARAVRLRAGDVLQIVDVRGQQVSDVMAWRLADPAEYLSPGHTVSCLKRLLPRQGEELFSNHRRPLLRIRRDTVGRHDLLVPCCDPERYQRDYGLSDHASCLASIQQALAEAGETWPARAELAWNVFMNNRLTPDGEIVTEPGGHAAGDYIELAVLDDLGVVASSCPQDLTACNGWVITEIGLRVFEPAP